MQVPAPFDYARASSVEEALSMLQRLGPEARLVAGGHSLLPMMKLRLATPEHLIDINPLEHELRYIRSEGDDDPHRRADPSPRPARVRPAARRMPIFFDAEQVIADPPVRNRGTIGGALCQADPAEDLSAVCAALGASVVIRGPQGERDRRHGRLPPRPVHHRGRRRRDARRGAHPDRDHAGSAYEKVERRAGDWAIAAAGAMMLARRRHVGDAGIALAAVGAHAPRSDRAEDALRGQPPSEEAFAEAARRAAHDCDPIADQRGPADYKRHLAAELTIRALRRAAERALAEEV